MKEHRYLATWRNPDAEQRYRDLDAALWQRELTRPPPEAIDVSTTFGSTRVHRWPADGPPVVFLHGMGDTSVRWVPYAERLAGYDVYAVDTMGDVGASEPTTGFASAADYPDWLGQTIGGLGLAKPTLVGESLGGYLALAYATTNPTTALVLFDPVGVVKLRLARFMAMGAWGLIGSVAPGPVRRLLGRRLHQPLLLDEQGLRLYSHGQRNHPPKLPPFPVFDDDELRSITAPTRVLVGGKSTVFDVDQLVQRVESVLPDGEAHLLPNAGHGFTVSHFDDCLAAVQTALTPSIC